MNHLSDVVNRRDFDCHGGGAEVLSGEKGGNGKLGDAHVGATLEHAYPISPLESSYVCQRGCSPTPRGPGSLCGRARARARRETHKRYLSRPLPSRLAPKTPNSQLDQNIAPHYDGDGEVSGVELVE